VTAQEKMNREKKFIMACLLLAGSFLLSSCGAGQFSGPTLTSTPTTNPTSTSTPIPPTLTPTSTPTFPPTDTPIPPTSTEIVYPPFPSVLNTSGKLNTSIGTLVITRAEIVSSDVSGNTASAGHQILQIWFDSADGSKLDTGSFFDVLEGVIVVGDDGSQIKRYSGGGVNNKLLAGFISPITAKKFWLYWPNNLPIQLNVTR
jgi:hypothetical protein